MLSSSLLPNCSRRKLFGFILPSSLSVPLPTFRAPLLCSTICYINQAPHVSEEPEGEENQHQSKIQVVHYVMDKKKPKKQTNEKKILCL